jgi:hypothetical protein
LDIGALYCGSQAPGCAAELVTGLGEIAFSELLFSESELKSMRLVSPDAFTVRAGTFVRPIGTIGTAMADGTFAVTAAPPKCVGGLNSCDGEGRANGSSALVVAFSGVVQIGGAG